MSNQNTLQTLKGFRDFLPTEKRKRDYVAQKMTDIFKRSGFEPLETPTIEYATLLLGKYGDEADKMVYAFEDRGKRKVGLRYDQTVPTARFLSQYNGVLPKYFRRYQIQNVFRAENTQKGRYREFTQCDCDIYGTNSIIADAEILAVFYATFKALGLTITIRVNDRQTLLNTLKPFETPTVSVFSIIQSIDKLDKLPKENVMRELEKKGIAQDKTKTIIDAIRSSKPTENLNQIIEYAKYLGVPKEQIEFTPSLARGLDYYTGLIFEGVMPEYSGGSIGGGGRYDNLINQLGGPEISAVGFAIGFDRTVETLDECKLLPSFDSTARVLVTIFNDECAQASAEIVRELRKQEIPSELYPSTSDKLSKQMKYANDKKIPFVIIVGPDEIKKNVVTLKNMQSGEEKTGKILDLIL